MVGNFRDRRAVVFSKNKGFTALQSACCCVEGSLIMKAICLTGVAGEGVANGAATAGRQSPRGRKKIFFLQ